VVLRTAAKVGLAGAVAAPIISTFVPAAAAAHSGGNHHTGALTPGYWKNHQNATTALLTQNLGAYPVSSFANATSVFANMNCGNSSSQNALGCLAGQLLAAKLNVANGVPNSCISAVIQSADSLLIKDKYVGPGGTYTLSQQDRNTAIQLAGMLATFDQNGC